MNNLDKGTLFFLACCLLLGAYSLLLTRRIAEPSSTDFYKFYKSARFFLEGKNIYTPVQHTYSEAGPLYLEKQDRKSIITLHPNLNSPIHTLIVVPFSLMPFRSAFLAWTLFSMVTGLFALYLIVRNVIPPESQIDSLFKIGLVLIAYFPSLVNILLGQYGFIVLFCAALIWLNARNERTIWGGIALGIAISIKIFFGFFFVFFAVRRQWSLLLAALGTLLFINLGGLFVFGINNYEKYLAQHSAVSLYINASWNASIVAFFTRIFGGAPNIPLVSAPRLGYSIVCGMGLLITLIVIWVSAARKEDSLSAFRFDIGFSLSLMAMLLISPYGWIYYFPCLIIPLIVYWRTTSHLKARRISRTIFCAAWILSSWPTALISSESEKLNNPIIWFTSAGYYHYALMTFFLMFTLLIIRKSRINPHSSASAF